MKIAVALFDRFTALDAVGPYEVLSRLPGAELTFVAKEKQLVRTDIGALGIMPGATFTEVEHADILVVPGGPGTRARMTDRPFLDWIARLHETTHWTTSVCTGSLLLGAAGLLRGVDAVTHWGAMDELAATGANPVSERVVVRGKIVTAAGVSAGIDMALTLAARIAGDEIAKAIQLGIEYDPQPPFDSGHPRSASPDTVQLIATMMRAEKPADAAA